ncbi:CysZ protein [Hamadaea flava]|uniref:EI24 domain-containing protein n=1 Tax=Hamadaea flava TaxID=1742688 RepID=A0ABV8LGW4_9ACTN|nr:EI24 domain-containing protein [Hamadaea flava]MCP2325672.1 CysZ protein [Hamadaea flava]
MMAQLFEGVRIFGRGLRIYGRNPGLVVLGIIPALITLLLFAFLFGLLLYFVDDLSATVTWFADDWSTGWRTATRIAAGVGLVGVAMLLWVVSFTAITLLIGDPFYEKIAEQVEVSLGGVPDEVDRTFWQELSRGLRDSLRLMLISTLFGIPLFLAGFIPIVGQTVIPVIGALVGGWFLAVELVGVAFSRRGLTFRDRVAKLRGHRWIAVGFGACVFLCFLIPLGAVFVMPAAVAGGTILARQVLGAETPVPAVPQA